MKSTRLLELDALRGIAALSVVLFHYFYQYDNIYRHENIAVDWASMGMFGVELFFMVSGFVIFWTLRRVEYPLDFIVSRFSRLYPAYWCAVIVSSLIVYYFPLQGLGISLTDTAINLLMFQEFLDVPHVDGVYWTLSVELTFYFWMLILYISGQLHKIEPLLVLWICTSILHSMRAIYLPEAINTLFILKYIPFFAAGICLYKITHMTANKTAIGVLFLSLASTLIIYSAKAALLFSLFYLIFFLAASGRMKFLSTKPLVFLGAISYSLYLLHQNIGYIVISQFYKNHWDPLLGILSSIVLCLFLATLSSKYIEKPSLVFIRENYKGSQWTQRMAEKLRFEKSTT